MGKQTMKPQVSFCIALKNRSNVPTKWGDLRLFQNCLEALINAHQPEKDVWELCICDFGSTDIDVAKLLSDSLRDRQGFTYQLCQLGSGHTFSRGAGLNQARNMARGNVLFYYDADMLMQTRQVLERGLQVAATGSAYFPIVVDLDRRGRSTGARTEGYGMTVLPIDLARRLPILERKAHGREDRVLFLLLQHQGRAVREQVDGFVHQWHPPAPKGKESEISIAHSKNSVARAKKGLLPMKLAEFETIYQPRKPKEPEKRIITQPVGRRRVRR